MDLPDRIEHLIEPTVEALGFDVVRVRLAGKRKPTLQVMVEASEGGAVTVDGCAKVSRAVSAVLDVDEAIAGPYTLEVSSPGIDRPLVRLGDFARFAGRQAKVEMGGPIDGRRRFRGRLCGLAGDAVRLQMDGETVELRHADIVRAKLVSGDNAPGVPRASPAHPEED